VQKQYVSFIFMLLRFNMVSTLTKVLLICQLAFAPHSAFLPLLLYIGWNSFHSNESL